MQLRKTAVRLSDIRKNFLIDNVSTSPTSIDLLQNCTPLHFNPDVAGIMSDDESDFFVHKWDLLIQNTKNSLYFHGFCVALWYFPCSMAGTGYYGYDMIQSALHYK